MVAGQSVDKGSEQNAPNNGRFAMARNGDNQLGYAEESGDGERDGSVGYLIEGCKPAFSYLLGRQSASR